MSSLDKLKRTGKIARFMVFAIFGAVIFIAIFGFVTEGQSWVSFGDDQFNQLWQIHHDKTSILLLLVAPAALTLLLGAYFLQRLLQQFSLGTFYSDSSVRCLKWLAWLTFFGVLYNMLLSPFALYLLGSDEDIEINIRPLTLIVVFCLPAIVQFFSAAREIALENNEII
jgi:hypothetical protein